MLRTTTIAPFLLLFLLALTAIQCKKNKSGIEALPPETQIGKNTFGCLVNGQILEPKGGGIAPNYDCYYQHISPGDSGYVFSVSGRDLSNSNNVRGVALGIGGIKLREGLQIPLTDGTQLGMGRGQYIGGNPTYQYIHYTTKLITGMLHLKKFDEVNRIAAGTFWFSAINSFGDTVKITDGRFDMKFTQ